MSEPIVVWYSRGKLADPVAVVGFPSIGLVSSIVTSYMAKGLGLGIAAGITSADLPPYTLVQGTVPLPPVRIFAGPAAKPAVKKSEGPAAEEEPKAGRTKRRDVVVVTSEIAPKPDQTYDFTMKLMETLREMGVKETICLEGIPNVDPAAQFMGAGSTDSMKTKLARANIPVMQEGLIRGVTGIMLYEGMAENVDVSCILCPANPQIPDPGAAANLLGPLAALIPGLEVDPKPLLSEAADIDKKVRQQQAQQSIGTQNIYG